MQFIIEELRRYHNYDSINFENNKKLDSFEYFLKITEGEILENEDQPFDFEELMIQINSLKIKQDKAPGSDNITNWMILNGPKEMKYALLMFFNICFQNTIIPEQWNEGHMNHIYKGKNSDKESYNNQRPITLLQSIGKLYTKLLYARSIKQIEKKLAKNQFGFRPNKGCRDNLTITELALTHIKKKTYCFMMDAKKAFDLTCREAIWIKLRRLGMSSLLWNNIIKWYDNSYVKANWNGIETSRIDQTQGVRQGCVLSGLLFAVFIDDLATELENAGICITLNGSDGEKIPLSNLLYADDLMLLADSLDELRRGIQIIEHWSFKWRMIISKEKSKILILNRKRNEPVETNISGYEVVYKFDAYLGITLDSNLTYKDHISKIQAKCTYPIHALKVIRQQLGPSVAKQSYLAHVRSRMEYGLASITLNKTQIKKLENMQNESLRNCIGAHRSNNNAWITGELGVWSMKGRIQFLQLKELHRIYTEGHSNLTKQIFDVCASEWDQQGRISRWAHSIREALFQLDLSHCWRNPRHIRNISANNWDKLLRKNMYIYEEQKWRAAMEKTNGKLLLYKETAIFGEIKKWDKLLSDNKQKKFLSRWKASQLYNYHNSRLATTTCLHCNVDNTRMHQITECPNYNFARNIVFSKIESNLYLHEINIWTNLSTKEKALYSLGKSKWNIQQESLEKIWIAGANAWYELKDQRFDDEDHQALVLELFDVGLVAIQVPESSGDSGLEANLALDSFLESGGLEINQIPDPLGGNGVSLSL